MGISSDPPKVPDYFEFESLQIGAPRALALEEGYGDFKKCKVLLLDV